MMTYTFVASTASHSCRTRGRGRSRAAAWRVSWDHHRRKQQDAGVGDGGDGIVDLVGDRERRAVPVDRGEPVEIRVAGERDLAARDEHARGVEAGDPDLPG